ncbi:hypothetical protein ACPPVS_13965 [Cellulomonas sp. McL0617]|uniref:hypothetical protein n=1 Tax=Cellulomonas sp. McL0617 TaxID=3415675 RepID=UPI003CF62F17
MWKTAAAVGAGLLALGGVVALAQGGSPVGAHESTHSGMGDMTEMRTLHGPGHQIDLRAVGRAGAATAKYFSLPTARADGYAPLADAAGIQCIDKPGVGAMGVHYVRGDLVADPTENTLTPEALVYEPTRQGGLRLVALEYVVLQADWNAKHASPPRLFGQEFMAVDGSNRYGLPPFYALHVWLWQRNPSGLFADYNPAVSCALSTESYD